MILRLTPTWGVNPSARVSDASQLQVRLGAQQVPLTLISETCFHFNQGSRLEQDYIGCDFDLIKIPSCSEPRKVLPCNSLCYSEGSSGRDSSRWSSQKPPPHPASDSVSPSPALRTNLAEPNTCLGH